MGGGGGDENRKTGTAATATREELGDGGSGSTWSRCVSRRGVAWRGEAPRSPQPRAVPAHWSPGAGRQKGRGPRSIMGTTTRQSSSSLSTACSCSRG